MKLDAPNLKSGDLHLWELDLDHFILGDVLSDEERARAEKFRFDHDRKRFTAGRTALRMLLAAYSNISAEKVQLSYGPSGKPFAPDSRLAFNLAHSGSHAMLAFASGGQVGVDIEEVRVIDDMETVAQFSFSEGEFCRWRALPVEQRIRAFYRCWTRKEAYLKATGEGIAKRLKTFEVAFESGETPRILRGAEGTWLLIDVSRDKCAGAVACDWSDPALQRFSLASI